MIQKHEISQACNRLRQLKDFGVPKHIIDYLEASALEALTQETKVQFGVDRKAKIQPGDMVLVEFTDGAEDEFLIGRIDKFIHDEPCAIIDGQAIDLAGEGHSSNIHKLTHFGNTFNAKNELTKFLYQVEKACIVANDDEIIAASKPYGIGKDVYTELRAWIKHLELIRPVPNELNPIKFLAGQKVFEAYVDQVKDYLRVGSKVTTDFIERDKKVVRTVTAINNCKTNSSTGINVCADSGNKLHCAAINGTDGTGIDLNWFTVIEY